MQVIVNHIKSNNGPNLLVAPNLLSEKNMLHVPLLQSRCQSVPNWGKLLYIYIEETKLNYIDSQFNWIFVVPSVCDKKKTAPDPQF